MTVGDTGGTELWSVETGDRVTSSPTVVGDTVYIGSDDDAVYALDAGDGSEQWRFETGDSVRSSPAVADGTVYVGSSDSRVYALDAGVSGSSRDTRVRQRILGHHDR